MLKLLCAALLLVSGPGFRTRGQLDEHYQKHGVEFGRISEEEYLALAQRLRDEPKSGPILEFVREDGVITRFDKKQGFFGAYNPNGIIRTFFVPNDGERYFWRQARKRHE